MHTKHIVNGLLTQPISSYFVFSLALKGVRYDILGLSLPWNWQRRRTRITEPFGRTILIRSETYIMDHRIQEAYRSTLRPLRSLTQPESST